MSDEGIKIVDKRRFSNEGEVREESSAASAESFKRAEENFQASSRQGDAPSVDFSSFVVGLAHQTMVMLGEIPDPNVGSVHRNLEAARQTIDILGVLEEKTKGNLTPQEARLLEDILTSLRLAYVKRVKSS